MTASEFAFMALGLVLGGASGAALVFVIGSRPPAPREIRLTVGQDAIPRRVPATLSTDGFTTATAQPARGGPADRRSADRHAGSIASDQRAASPAASSEAIAPAPAVPISAPAVLVTSARVGIPIVREPDPAFAAIRAGAPRAQPTDVPTEAPTEARSERRDRAPEAAWPQRPQPAIAQLKSELKSERQAEPESEPRVAVVAVLDRAPGARAGTGAGPTTEGGASQPASPATPGRQADPPASNQDGPCATAESIADERCRQADVARLGAERATEAAATAQHDYDELRGQAERARAASDPRAVQELKESARSAFRAARRAARDRAGLDAAARTWLTTINQLNGIARDATHNLGKAEAAALTLLPTLERLAAESDAARVTAETAAGACREAGASLAACREAAANDRRAAETLERLAASAAAPSQQPEVAETMHLDTDVDLPGADGGALSADRGPTVVVRIVQGDREARSRVAAALLREAGESDRPWADLLSEFADGVRMRAIDAALIDLPAEDPFWGQFAGEERREIVSALSALGYRYDGLGGWLDERMPNQRDLSRAVGYAGQDPMRVRNWPAESQMASLLEDAHVAADEYLLQAGGELSLGEVVDLLGARADSLTGLWDVWATVRPLLLAPAEDPGSV